MNLKQCFGCKKFKKSSDFCVDINHKDGLYSQCRECRIKYMRVYMKTYSKKYPWKDTFYKIKQRCNNHKATGYKYYGGKGIKCLITEEEIKYLWFRDKAYLMKQPSIDRKNSGDNYTLDNCRYIEKSKNSARQTRSILQYDLKGKFIKEWDSIKEAANSFNGHGPCIIQGIQANRIRYGFYWKYKNKRKEIE